MLSFGNKEFRNLEEQVRKNQSDIQELKAGVKVEKWLLWEQLAGYVNDNNVGKYYVVNHDSVEHLYLITRRANEGLVAVDLGRYPALGPQGPTGAKGDKGDKGDSIIGPRGYKGDQGAPGRGVDSLAGIDSTGYTATISGPDSNGIVTIDTSADVDFGADDPVEIDFKFKYQVPTDFYTQDEVDSIVSGAISTAEDYTDTVVATIPAGPQGPQGEQGPEGEPGTPGGNENFIINEKFNINQRAYTNAGWDGDKYTTDNANQIYCFDRWLLTAYAPENETNTATFGSSHSTTKVLETTNVGEGYSASISQIIENGVGKLWNPAGSNDKATVSVFISVGTGNWKINVYWVDVSNNNRVSLVSSSDIYTTHGGRRSYTFTVPRGYTEAADHIIIEILTYDYMQIQWVNVEQGTTGHYPKYKTINEQFNECARYYWDLACEKGINKPYQLGQLKAIGSFAVMNTSSHAGFVDVHMPVEMRTTPTTLNFISSKTGTTAYIYVMATNGSPVGFDVAHSSYIIDSLNGANGTFLVKLTGNVNYGLCFVTGRCQVGDTFAYDAEIYI